MVREAKIRGRVQTEVDERQLRQSTEEIKSKMDSATNIVPQLDTSRLRRRLERLVPGGRTASRAIRELGGSDGGGGSGGSGGPPVQQEQLRELRRIRRTIQKDAVTPEGGGGGGNTILAGGGLSGIAATAGKAGLGIAGLGAALFGAKKVNENAPRGYQGELQDEDRLKEANERLYSIPDDTVSFFENLSWPEPPDISWPDIPDLETSTTWPEIPDLENSDWPDLPDLDSQDWPEIPDLQSVTDWPELPNLDSELDWPELPDLSADFSWPDPPDWIEQPFREMTGTEESETPARDAAASGVAEMFVEVSGLDSVGVGDGANRRELEQIIEDYLQEELR